MRFSYRKNPARQFGQYQIIEELARGGQGVVYKARHPQLDRLVAIKLLLDSDPRSIKRFKQEAMVLAKLQHPHLLKVMDMGIANGKPYIAMEYISGYTIKDVVRNDGIPRFSWTTGVLEAIANALEYCHDNGIVHRDLKPDNILIEEETGRPILVDFGLIKRDISKMQLGSLDSSKLSLTGETKGTPSYMAPEQADSSFGETGPWSDVYGLGATLYFMITGQAPYAGATVYNIIVKVLRDEPPMDPREINPEIPDGLADLCMRSLEKNSELRPESMAEFSELLRMGLQSRRRRFKRLPKRRIAAASFLLGAGLLGGGGYYGYTIREAAIAEERGLQREVEIRAQAEVERRIREERSPIKENRWITGSRKLTEDASKHFLAADAVKISKADRMHHFLEAIGILNKALELWPENGKAYFDRGRAKGSLAQMLAKEKNAEALKNDNLRQAIADLESALLYLPQNSSLYRRALDSKRRYQEELEGRR